MTMKLITIGLTLLAFVIAGMPLQAQIHNTNVPRQDSPTIAKSVQRLAAALQPTTRRGGGETMWWTGWAMVASGGLLAALSNNVFSRKDVSVSSLYPGDCDIPAAGLDCTKLNHGTLWAGLGLVGVGALMATMGNGRRQPSVHVIPMTGGGAVFKQVGF